MSTVIFEGNTYTFGATVSANPGTGTTSYVFGGLSSGETYGFILRAFNGFGFSDFVGPISKFTESMIEESRELIGAFSWGYPNGLKDIEFNYYSGSTLNLFYDTETLSPTWWDRPELTRTPYSELLPIGHTGWQINTSSGFAFLQQGRVLDAGHTYIVSWYQHTGSSAGLAFSIFGQGGGTDTVPVQQILPQLGTGTTSSVGLNLLGPTGGQTGWIRYAVQFYTTGQKRIFRLPFLLNNIVANRSFIIGALQLEKVN